MQNRIGLFVFFRRKTAFSLVEVTLAIGVAAFALVAIFGLLPTGLASNQNSVDQTTAAGFASSLVADLRATPSGSSISPRFQIPIPTTGSSKVVLFLKDNGEPSNTTVNTDASAASDPSCRASFYFSAPTTAGLRTVTNVRVLLTWPALADKIAANDPTNFRGSFEALTTLDRN